MPIGNLGKSPFTALAEIQGNQQDHGSRSPAKQLFDEYARGRSRSPTKSPIKSAFPALKSVSSRWTSDKTAAASRETSPTKAPKSKKSSTNLAGLLSRPKSLIQQQQKSASQDKQPAFTVENKENRIPESSLPPIYAQFATACNDGDAGAGKKPRPQSCHPTFQGADNGAGVETTPRKIRLQLAAQDEMRSFPDGAAGRRNGGGGHARAKSVVVMGEPAMDPSQIAVHLEALLDRRNIPQNQRYKMRNLSDTIKMEFIRQDWAEMKAGQSGCDDSSGGSLPRSDGSTTATGISSVSHSDQEEDAGAKQARGRSRGRSFTFARSKRDRSAPKKPSKALKLEGTIGRHFRSKSTESIGRHHPESPSWTSSSSSGVGPYGVLAKFKFQQGPGDYVAYLRKVQKPELVEVGKVHKLRLLLRNETVAWTEEFIRQGGMEEIVGLLNRIINVEWREEHEDGLLHENLLCLKALSTTALGMAYVHSVQADLFPKLLHMIFDPEKKGPSEFTTRNVVTSMLLMYISAAAPAERIIRAKNVLGHLRDPQPREEERPLQFVLEMRRDRPFRVWCKEVASVTKEVFWIFLHTRNVIALPKQLEHNADMSSSRPASSSSPPSNGASRIIAGGERRVVAFDDAHSSFVGGHHGRHHHHQSSSAPYSYMHRHFGAERAPVAAAPYVGGVEWDATNYLASHLDLVNAIVACAATREARAELRAQLRMSGWERLMGGSLRLCKEKFYGSVHAALRTWVAAAAEDGWDVADVRFGPEKTAEEESPKRAVKVKQNGKVDGAPQLEMLRF